MRRLLSVWLAGALTLAVTAAYAKDKMDAEISLRGSEIRVNLGAGLSNATLTISGPNGFYTQTYSEHGSPSIDLIRAGGTADGVYMYEVTAATSETVENTDPLNRNRDGSRIGQLAVPAYTFGSFHASGGLITGPASQANKN